MAANLTITGILEKVTSRSAFLYVQILGPSTFHLPKGGPFFPFLSMCLISLWVSPFKVSLDIACLLDILMQMTGKDKDYRYMATSDLLNELNKEGFKLDVELEGKLSNIVLQQLDDVAGDVSGLAVKW